MLLVVVALVAVGIFVWVQRTTEMFYVSVRDGRAILVRGRIPAGLLRDIRDVVSQPPIRRGSVCARKAEHGARLEFGGDIDEGRGQRMRNAFALYPASRLRAAPPMARPTLGQVLGIAWLAWLFDRWTRS